MRLRQFTPRQPIPDIPIKPPEWQSDPEVITKHDDFFATAWECEYEKPRFDSDYNNLVTPNSPEHTIRSEEEADELRNTARSIPESSAEKPLRQSDHITERTRITICSLMRILV